MVLMRPASVPGEGIQTAVQDEQHPEFGNFGQLAAAGIQLLSDLDGSVRTDLIAYPQYRVRIREQEVGSRDRAVITFCLAVEADQALGGGSFLPDSTTFV
ncbi:hypothetical protein D3C73_1156920 [compost metagenome]